MSGKTLILDSKQISQKIDRMAYEVFEHNHNEKEIVIAGIDGMGYTLAERVQKAIEKLCPVKVTLLKIKVDKENPIGKEPILSPASYTIKNKVVILVDDVLNSGKTLIYGAKVFLGEPLKRLSTLVLIDRSHNRYPIKADYIGLPLSTTLQEHITVDLSKNGKEAVHLE